MESSFLGIRHSQNLGNDDLLHVRHYETFP